MPESLKGCIVARGLAKRYCHRLEKSASIKELFVRAASGRLLGKWSSPRTSPSAPKPAPETGGQARALRAHPRAIEIQALESLDLVIEPGEAVGVIGANGSGKSTLLKLIAGITQPTNGTLEVGGRVATLLELGAGFHPDLPGLENIFLMASMLGLTRAETSRRLDAIIDFAGVRPFIHTPVKHYSTGMAVRLGFSVATHLDPDIVLLDEVISVGDADFQAKSLERVQAMRDEGKTIILVTHQIDAVEWLCGKILWLDHGRAKAWGDAFEVLERFKGEAREAGAKTEMVAFDPALSYLRPTVRMGSGEAVIERVEMLGAERQETRRFGLGEAICVRIHYRLVSAAKGFTAWIGFSSAEGAGLSLSTSGLGIANPLPAGVFECRFDPMVFGAGLHWMSVALCPIGTLADPYDAHLRLYPFEITSARRQRLRPLLNLPCETRILPGP